MREAISIIISSSTVLPPSAAPHRRDHRGSAAKPRPTYNLKHKPQFTSTSNSNSPLISSFRWYNRQSLTYNTELASKLAEDGKIEDFLMIAESAVASGVKASEFSALLSEKNVARGIERMIREGKFDSVGDVVFNGVSKLDVEPARIFDGAVVEVMRGECNRMIKCGEIDRLLKLMEAFHGFQFSITKLVEPSEIINLCIKKKNPSAAIRYAQLFPYVEILLCTIILEFGKKGDLASALIAFEASKQTSSCPNMHACRTIIDVCGICGDYMKSRTIYEEMLGCKVTPNTYVFNSLMNVNAFDLNYTMKVFKQMQEIAVPADIASHNILLKSCCLASKVKLAKDIYAEIRNLEAKGAVKLDVYTYSTMIKVFADAKMWKLALQVKQDMLTSGVTPNTVTWSSLISACANAGFLENAFTLFNEMLLSGVQPNSHCVNILLHACVESCQFDRAFRLFRRWKETGFRETEYKDTNQINETVRVPFRPTTSTYNTLMKACGSDYYRAKGLMDEMKSLGISPDCISWSILIDVRGGSGNLASAMQVFRSMRENGIQPDVITYTTAIKVCVEHKNPKLAFLLFAEMKKYQIKPNSVTYSTILRARSRYGSLEEVQQCLAVYQDMRKAGYKSNDYYLKQLVEEWCEGVIQNNHKDKCQFSKRRTDFGPASLLLEKVAEHLQESQADSLSIDLRGLTKVEARIVVLAVLRKIKEKYIAGDLVKDDVVIILGVQKLLPDLHKDETVKDGVMRLLQHDLGLQVFSAGFSTRNDKRTDMENQKVVETRDLSLTLAPESPPRRPVVLQRLKISRESLQQWLQRRMSA